MLASFVSWWVARVIELLPGAWRLNAVRLRDGIVVEVASNDDVVVWLRRRGLQQPLSLGAAARLAGRYPVFLRPPAGRVLVKRHTVPTAPRRHLSQMLYHELGRITPFPGDGLFWNWDGRARAGDASRTDVILTMVPKSALADVVARLGQSGLKADFVEVGPPEQIRLLPIGAADRASGTRLVRGLSVACASLAVIAMLLPIVMQALALRATEAAIETLKPAIAQVDALRRGIASGEAGQATLAREAERTGDLLQILATVTRILPDDTYLTDFSLR
jgi:general secretion pathway protein L